MSFNIPFRLDISPAGGSVLVAADAGVTLWDLKDLEPIRRMEGSYGNFDVKFSPDGKRALSSSRERGSVCELTSLERELLGLLELPVQLDKE